MANGDNHAKQIVIGQAEELAEKLANGSGADPKTQGQAIGLLVQMVKPMYAAEFVTIQACASTRGLCAKREDKKHREILQKIEYAVQNGSNGPKQKKATLQLGPLSLAGPVVPIFVVLAVLLVPTGALLYVLSKLQGWL